MINHVKRVIIITISDVYGEMYARLYVYYFKIFTKPQRSRYYYRPSFKDVVTVTQKG